MKNTLLVLLFVFLVSSCRLTQHYSNYIEENQYGRTKLKEMKLKRNSEKLLVTSKISIDAVYYYYNEDIVMDTEFKKTIRFFEYGQYAFFSSFTKPIENQLNSSEKMIDYNNLEKATYVGYYNIKDSIIILEKPNHLFRRSGQRNLDKYKVLPNGDLKSITRQASDYGAIYKKIPITEKSFIEVVPDW